MPTLRADLGAAMPARWSRWRRPTKRAALARAEAAGARLDALVDAGRCSPATNRRRACCRARATQARAARRAARRATLRARLAEATADGPLAAPRLGAFVADVQAARAQRRRRSRRTRRHAARRALDALLVPGTRRRPWRVLLNLQPARAADRRPPGSAPRSPTCPTCAWSTSSTSSTRSTRATCTKPCCRRSLGALAVVRAARAVPALGAAPAAAWPSRSPPRCCSCSAALRVAGAALGILHLVGLLLVVAVGSNYALFFDQLRERGRADEDTLASLLLANLTTVVSFGLIALSSIPALLGDRPGGGARRVAVRCCCRRPSSPRGRGRRDGRCGKIAAALRSAAIRRMHVRTLRHTAARHRSVARRRCCVRPASAWHAGAGVAAATLPAQWPWALGARRAEPRAADRRGPVAALDLARARTSRACRPRGGARAKSRSPSTTARTREVTPAVLDLLDAHGARATFFCIAERARRAPGAVRARSCARGHSVQNHSHAPPPRLLAARRRAASPRDRPRAGRRSRDSPASAPRFFRAPAGLRNPLLDPVLHRLGPARWSAGRGAASTPRERDPQRVLAAADARPAPPATSCCCTTATPRARRAAGRWCSRCCRAAAALRAGRPAPVTLPRSRRVRRRPLDRMTTRRRRPQRAPGAACSTRRARRTAAPAASPGTSRAASWARDPVFRAPARARADRAGARACSTSAAARACWRACCAPAAAAAAREPLAGRLARRAAPARVTGIELMPRDVERAARPRSALAPARASSAATCARAASRSCDAVVILDVLHYIDARRAGRRCCARVRDALAPGGVLLLRVGDAAAAARFALSQWVDRVVTRAARPPASPPPVGRPLAEWTTRCAALGFDVELRADERGHAVRERAAGRRRVRRSTATRMKPLPIIGLHADAPRSARGRRRDARGAARRAQRARAAAASTTSTLPTWIGEVDGARRRSSLPAGLADFDCRNNRLAQLGAAAGRLRRRGARGARALGRAAHRRVHRHQHLGHPADRARLPPARRRDGALPADFHYAQTQNTFSVAEFVAQRARAARARAGVVSTACSSSAKVFGNAARMIAAGLDRCRRRRRRRHAVPDDALRLQLARAAVARALPAVRCRRATASRSAKARPSRCSSATADRAAAAGCSASARAATATTCPRRIPKAPARVAAMRGALARGRPRSRGDIDYINLHGTAHAEQRRGRGQGGLRRLRRARRRAARPRARPATRSARPAASKR